jgi:hypothetical protein
MDNRFIIIIENVWPYCILFLVLVLVLVIHSRAMDDKVKC